MPYNPWKQSPLVVIVIEMDQANLKQDFPFIENIL